MKMAPNMELHLKNNKLDLITKVSILGSDTAGVSTVLALFLHFVLKTCHVQLHLPMLLLANLVSVPVEVKLLNIHACLPLAPKHMIG